MTNLKAVKEGHNKYCGPAVLSIVTGKDTDTCANAISQVNGQYKVQGVYLKDLKLAADKLGFRMVDTPFVGRSLYSALVSIVQFDGIYIVELSGAGRGAGHLVCIEIVEAKIYFCDNHTKEPMPAASSARMMQGVVSISKVEMKPKPELLPERIDEFIMYKCRYCRSTALYPENLVHHLSCEYKLSIEANK